MRASIPDQVKLESPEGHKALLDQADAYQDRKFLPSQFADFNERNNATLHGIYKQYSVDQNTMLTANAAKRMLEAKADATRQAQYNHVNDYGGLNPKNGQDIAEIQRQYGVLARMRDAHQGFMDKQILHPAIAPMNFPAAAKAGLTDFSVPDLVPIMMGGKEFGATWLAGRYVQNIAHRMYPKGIADAVKIDKALAGYTGDPLPPTPEPQYHLAYPEEPMPPVIQQKTMKLSGKIPFGQSEPPPVGPTGPPTSFTSGTTDISQWIK
jgi:hypothetical protein